MAWKPLIPVYLDEMYRHDGIGVSGVVGCLTCNAEFSKTCRLFKCDACGVALECLDCIVTRHQCQPLHVIKVGLTIARLVAPC